METKKFVPKYNRKLLEKKDDIDFTNIIEKGEFNYVYRPGDDSYLFADALRFEIDNMISSNPMFCLEIGSGSGFLCNSVCNWFREKNFHNYQFFASDINYDAANLTRKVSEFFKNDIEILKTNILDGVARPDQLFDIIICNPPYVPTDEGELEKYNKLLENQIKTLNLQPESYKRNENHNGIDLSYAGGKDGNEITVKILAKVKESLSPKGTFYLLLIEDNKPAELLEQFFEEKSYTIECLLYQQFYNERIYIFRIKKIIVSE